MAANNWIRGVPLKGPHEIDENPEKLKHRNAKDSNLAELFRRHFETNRGALRGVLLFQFNLIVYGVI